MQSPNLADDSAWDSTCRVSVPVAFELDSKRHVDVCCISFGRLSAKPWPRSGICGELGER